MMRGTIAAHVGSRALCEKVRIEMAFDGDILQIKVFSDWLGDDECAQRVAKKVNDYLHNYPAELVVSVTPSVTEKTFPDGGSSMRYTVTVVLRS